MSDPAARCIGETRRRPTVRAGIVLAAGVQIVNAVSSAPPDHFAAGPHRSVVPSCRRRVYDRGSYPAVRGWIVPPAAVQVAVSTTSVSTPDDHFAASPYRRVMVSRHRRIGGAGSDPTIHDRVVSAAGVQFIAAIIPAPDNHLVARPHCAMNRSRSGCVGRARGGPAISSGIVSRACV